MVKELVVQKRAMVRLDPTHGDHGSVVEAVMDPTKDLNSREQLLLLGVTLDEIGITPEDVDIEAIQIELIEHVFRLTGQKIEDGLRDRLKPVINFLLNTIGMKVAGVLQQVKRELTEGARTRDAEIMEKTDNWGWLGWPWFMNTKNPADEKLGKVDDVITRINAQVDELRKAVRKSFFLDADVPKEVVSERKCAELLEALSSVAGDAYKKVQEQMDSFGSRTVDEKVPSSYEFIVAFDMAKSFAESLYALCISGDVDGQYVRMALRIVEDTRAIPDLKPDDNYVVDGGFSCDTRKVRMDFRPIMRGLARVSTLCSGLEIVLMDKIERYEQQKMAEFMKDVG